MLMNSAPFFPLFYFASPQPLPQEGGANTFIMRAFPLLSWKKGARGMRSIFKGEFGFMESFYSFKTFATVIPISAGDSTT